MILHTLIFIFACAGMCWALGEEKPKSRKPNEDWLFYYYTPSGQLAKQVYKDGKYFEVIVK